MRRLWLLLLMVSAPAFGLAGVDSVPAGILGGKASLAEREHQLWTTPADSEFALPDHPATLAAWSHTSRRRWPRPILLDEIEVNSKASVSFIIGTDGRVQCA